MEPTEIQVRRKVLQFHPSNVTISVYISHFRVMTHVTVQHNRNTFMNIMIVHNIRQTIFKNQPTEPQLSFHIIL